MCNLAGTAATSRVTSGSSRNESQGVNNGNGNVNGTSRGRRSQRRAAIYRAQKETTRQIRLVDEWGNREFVRQRGKMNITKHTRVLSALERRAHRYRNKGRSKQDSDDILYDAAIDETGTVGTVTLTDSDCESESSEEEMSVQQFLESGICEDLLKIHGVAPGRKAEGVIRVGMENMNGMPNHINGNEKLEKSKEIADELELDILAMTEHKGNLAHKDNRNGFRQMYQGGEAEVRTQVAHNVHENVARTQEGGCGLILFGPLVAQYDFEDSGKDPTGMGRWTVMTFRGAGEVTTRVVSGYMPNYVKRKNSNSSYQQQRRHLISRHKDCTCPRTRLRQDLIKQLKEWRGAGDRIILGMDANEHVYKKGLGKMLTDNEGLGMVEVVGAFTGKKIGATYFRNQSSKPIDAIWATPDVTVVGACIMPVGYGVGDHRMFIVDFLTSSLVGRNPPTIVRSQARRLNTMIPGTEEKYLKVLEELVRKHDLNGRLAKIYVSNVPVAIARTEANKVDNVATACMTSAEKKCRRIKSGRIPFSPESSLWIRRCQVYRSALRYHAGKIRNKGNLKRAARRCGIKGILNLPLSELRQRLKYAKSKCKYFRKHGGRYRRKHLNERLAAAMDRRDEEAEKRILDIIRLEKERSRWRRYRYATSKPRGRSARVVQATEDDGRVVDISGREAVEDAIWDRIHRHRFYGSESAPICGGELREEFGYMANTAAAREVLQGTYSCPPDMHEGTKDIFEECARLRSIIPPDSASGVYTPENFQNSWKGVSERISSSPSTRHFGHYIAATKSYLLSHLHSLMISIANKWGFALERWLRGMTCMMEKKPGITLIEKLRAIVLLEADYNKGIKEMFGMRMLAIARQYGLMPEEIFSERGRTADDGGLAKVLVYDISRQARVPASLTSADAKNCYDSIAHAIASIIFQALGVTPGAVESMLEAIQNMKYFLRTAYGDSRRCAGSRIEIKFQGMCQGSGAAPAGWCAVSIVIIRAHGRKGHGATFVCPVSNKSIKLAAIVFVDDTDLIHINLAADEDVEDVHCAMQESIDSWGELLIASGGTLNPDKCFAYLISYWWTAQGKWRYASNEDKEEFGFEVPLSDGSRAPIKHLGVDHSEETLGIFSCPSGKQDEAIKKMQDKADEWIGRAKDSHLGRRDIWFLVERQLWMGLKYGLCCNSSKWSVIEDVLRKQWFQLVPMGGVIRSAPVPLRQMDAGFYGVGCPHVGVECFIEQANKLLMHYGCPSSIGFGCKVSLEYMILELGVSFQPLQLSYKKYSKRLTDCWLKSLWEKCQKFGVVVTFHHHEQELQMPRDGDKWLMLEFERLGCNVDTLERLNRVRIFMQALFLSDLLGASGKCLDRQYLVKRRLGERWSRANFPNERPPQRDFNLWARIIRQLVPSTGIPDRLGPMRVVSHKLWPWRHDVEEGTLVHVKGELMDVYKPSQLPRYRNVRNRWTRLLCDQPAEKLGDICTVREVAPAVMAIASATGDPPAKSTPECFLELLEEWGCTWMWESIRMEGTDGWLEESIQEGTLRAVTDGSYMREVFPDVCSAAFVLECSKGRGRIMGSFPEHSSGANAYRAELLGLLAVHLILLAISRTHVNLAGHVEIYSDCVGALGRILNLPTTRIPSSCKHADILKNIMINCRELPFSREYLHVRGHQDDKEGYSALCRPAQLNCWADFEAKGVLWGRVGQGVIKQRPLPLEPVTIWVGNHKLTPDTSVELRFWVHRMIAKEVFVDLKLLDVGAFDEVAWRQVFDTMHSLPRLFQIWACKQATDIAATNKREHAIKKRKKIYHDPRCPSCNFAIETCSHVLHCREAGRVDLLQKSIDDLEQWLLEAETETGLRHAICSYARGRGAVSMSMAIGGQRRIYGDMADSQDLIGWRRFMEGMISRRMVVIQRDFCEIVETKMTAEQWARGLIIKLLEITHGQWLYRNVHVHDKVTGTLATKRKEELKDAILDQLYIGEEGLAEEDKYLLEINLEDLETTSGIKQHYWLLAIRAARMWQELQAEEEGGSVANEGVS